MTTNPICSNPTCTKQRFDNENLIIPLFALLRNLRNEFDITAQKTIPECKKLIASIDESKNNNPDNYKRPYNKLLGRNNAYFRIIDKMRDLERSAEQESDEKYESFMKEVAAKREEAQPKKVELKFQAKCTNCPKLESSLKKQKQELDDIKKECKDIELKSQSHAKNNESMLIQLKELQSKNLELVTNIKCTTDKCDHKITQLTGEKRKIEVQHNQVKKKLVKSESENKEKGQEIRIKTEEIQMIRKEKERTLEELERFKRKDNSWNLKFRRVMVKPEIFEKMKRENPECIHNSSGGLKTP